MKAHLSGFNTYEVVVSHALISVGVPENGVLISSSVGYGELQIAKG